MKRLCVLFKVERMFATMHWQQVLGRIELHFGLKKQGYESGVRITGVCAEY